MLRHSLAYQVAGAVALALLASSPAGSQGLNQRLDSAEQKLSEDQQACRPIDVGEYASLVNEAYQNKQRAAKAARSGLPIDEAQLTADLTRATMLLHGAQAAHAQQCVRQTTQPQTQLQTNTPTQTSAPGTPPPQQAEDSAPVGTGLRIDQAEAKLNDDIKNCRPVDPADYLPIMQEAQANYETARMLQRDGFPVQGEKILFERERATRLHRRAVLAAAKQRDCPPQPPATQQQSLARPATLDGFAQRILDVHNQERTALGLQPYYWSVPLAEGAQQHANYLARTGVLAHASREGRGTARENLNQGMIGWNADQMIDNWLDEKRLFRPGIFPNVSATGDWNQVGHYSQMIWPDTSEIGCGMATGSGFQWLVCRYSPGGNKDGRTVGFPMQPQQVAERSPHSQDSSGNWERGYNYGVRVDEEERRASLFDLGLYGGGAWTSDWFTDDLGLSTQASGASCAPGIDELSYVDLALSYRVGDQYSFRLGVNSLLDRDPPAVDGAGSAGSANSWPNVYDALGRYIYAGCALNF